MKIDPEAVAVDAVLQGGTLADSIRKASKALEALLSSGLNERAVIALVADRTRLRKTEIKSVLDSLQAMERDYTTHE